MVGAGLAPARLVLGLRYSSINGDFCQIDALVHVIIHSGKVQYVEKWVKV